MYYIYLHAHFDIIAFHLCQFVNNYMQSIIVSTFSGQIMASVDRITLNHVFDMFYPELAHAVSYQIIWWFTGDT